MIKIFLNNKKEMPVKHITSNDGFIPDPFRLMAERKAMVKMNQKQTIGIMLKELKQGIGRHSK